MPLRKALAAGCAGGASAFICTPLDLIKVRMMAQGMRPCAEAPPRYRSLPHAAASIFRHEGPFGLYKGAGPASARATIVGMVEIGPRLRRGQVRHPPARLDARGRSFAFLSGDVQWAAVGPGLFAVRRRQIAANVAWTPPALRRLRSRLALQGPDGLLGQVVPGRGLEVCLQGLLGRLPEQG
ncbi:unnamed protein product, partial [Prorocentrum cordatum]